MCRAILLMSVLGVMMSGAMAQDSVDGVEAKVREAWAKNKSLSADVAVDASVPMGQTRLLLTGGGTMQYLNDNGKEKFRQAIALKMPEPMKLEIKADALFDGADLYVTTDVFGKKSSDKSQPELLKGALPPGGGMLFDVLKKEMNLSVKPESTVDGKATYVLEAAPKDAAGMDAPISNALVYIDKETGMAVKTEINDTAGAKLGTLSFSNIKVNPEMPASVFVYVPPAPEPPAEAAVPAAQPAAAAQPAPAKK